MVLLLCFKQHEFFVDDIVDVGENHNRNENIKVSPKYMVDFF